MRHAVQHHARRAVGLFLVAAALLTATVGWKRLYRGTSPGEQDFSRITVSSSGNPRETKVLHDIGVIRPGQRRKLAFEIRNNSDFPWTFKEISSSCSCASALRTSDRQIDPGESEFVDVLYHAVGGSRDDRRLVTVRFHEQAAPTVLLEVRAQIRAPMTVRESDLAFGGLEAGEASSRTLEVKNYSDASWSELRVAADQPWANVTSRLIEKSNADDARQVWEVLVRLDTTGLPPGWRSAMVSISCNETEIEPVTIPITMSVIAPLEAVPPRLFFGAVTDSATSRVFVRLSPQREEVDPESVTVRHDLGDRLQVHIERRSASLWELIGVFTRGDQQGAISGSVRLTVPFTGGEEELVIPVVAMGAEK